jgi:hypothetical protein
VATRLPESVSRTIILARRGCSHAEHAIGIAVISYDGKLFFGVNADRDTVPDVEELVEGIRGSLAELRQLARAPSPTA